MVEIYEMHKKDDKCSGLERYFTKVEISQSGVIFTEITTMSQMIVKI